MSSALLAFLALGLILWGANVLYQEREQRQRHQIERELQAISQLQARSVADWRDQHATTSVLNVTGALLLELRPPEAVTAPTAAA